MQRELVRALAAEISLDRMASRTPYVEILHHTGYSFCDYVYLLNADKNQACAGLLDGGPPLRGSWALIAERDGELVVPTDSYGTRPLFWRVERRRARVADDIWSLLDDAPAELAIARGVDDAHAAAPELADQLVLMNVHSGDELDARRDVVLARERGWCRERSTALLLRPRNTELRSEQAIRPHEPLS